MRWRVAESQSLKLLCELGAADSVKCHQLKVRATGVTSRLPCHSRTKTDKLARRKAPKAFSKHLTESWLFAASFAIYDRRNKQEISGKAAGKDGLDLEFLKNSRLMG